MKGRPVRLQDLSPEEIAARFPVSGLSPEERDRVKAHRDFLISLVTNPIDQSSLLEARASGDPARIAAADRQFHVQLGMRAREFHLDAIAWRKLLGKLAENWETQAAAAAGAHADWRARRDRLKHENPKRTKTKIAELIRNELRAENAGKADYKVPAQKTIQNKI